MATPTSQRFVPQFPSVISPQAMPQPLTHLSPPKGMNTQLPSVLIPREVGRLVQNLLIRDGHYKTRDGTSVIGAQSGTRLLYATAVKLASGRTWNLRWRVNGVDYLKGSVWTPCSGDKYTAPATTQVSVTGWNDDLVFTVGVGKLMVISFDTGIPTVTTLADSPSNIGHVTTFAGRIIASARLGTRIHWCVKNDNTKWDPNDPLNQGAGFEDLLSAPGGLVDQQTAVVPISDEYAYAVRTNSVWQMTLTGNPDAPFRFTVLYQGIGSEYPGTVVAVRRGVCFPTRDTVILISPEGLQDIGVPIRERLRLDKKYLRDASATFDARDNEYVLSTPDANALGASTVWRFNMDVSAWVKEIYPFPIKSVAFIRYSQSLTIDELTGSIDQLTGTIDDLGQSDRTVGLMFAMGSTARLVARNNFLRNNDVERDVNSGGVTVAGGWRVETGDIIPQRSTYKMSIILVEVEYISDQDADLTFEYSEDGGTSWIQYATRTAPASSRTRVLRVTHTLERESLMLAVNCAATPTFRLLALHAYASTGGLVEDGR